MSSDLSSYWRSVEEIQRLLDGVSIDSTKLNVKLPFFAQFSNNKVTRSLKIIEARMKETAKKSEQLKEVTDLLHERLSLMASYCLPSNAIPLSPRKKERFSSAVSLG